MGFDLIAARHIILAQNGMTIPPLYQKTDWLQASGVKTKIDTGVSGGNANLLFDFDYLVVTRVNYAMIFGNYKKNTKSWSFALAGSGITNKCNSVVYEGSKQITVSQNNMAGQKINFRISNLYYCVKNGNYTNSETLSPSITGNACTDNIAIGVNTLSQEETSTYDSYQARFYKFKIYDNGILIRNYIPVYRKSDNKAGFWDTVNSTFNPSNGSVDFTAGYDS